MKIVKDVFTTLAFLFFVFCFGHVAFYFLNQPAVTVWCRENIYSVFIILIMFAIMVSYVGYRIAVFKIDSQYM